LGKSPWHAALTAAALALVAGCTVSVPGVPRSTGRDFPPAAVDVAVLDTGGYPTTPGPPPGKAGSEAYGRVLEGQRMANYVVVPTEVDPALTEAIPQNTSTLTTADDLPEPLDSDDAQDFVVGFSTARRSIGARVLINAVLRFTNPAVAADAAGDVAALYVRMSGVPAQYAGVRPAGAVPIPRHPSTVAFASETDEGTELHSATAHGSYVLFQYALSKAGLGGATALIAKTLDLQEPLIDQFVPDEPSHFADLPADTTGLFSRTLRKDPRYAPSPGVWVLYPAAALHIEDDPAGAGAMFAKTDVQAVSVGKTVVYQTADADGARLLAEELTADSQNGGYQPAAEIRGLPTARCLDGGRGEDVSDGSPRRFYCVGFADRFTFEVYSDREVHAHQEAAAQYLMLIGHRSL
jgi:hypothetical protein